MDRDRLEALVLEHGQQGAERFMGRTLEDLAVRLNRAERHFQRGEFSRLSGSADGIAALARDVGLTGLARAATAVSDVADRYEPAALAATSARMMRVGEASLMSAWDLEDRSV